MSREIQLSKNKTLKLTNVLIYESIYGDSDENENIDVVVTKIDNYIKSKGALPIGPIIQKVSYILTDDGQFDVKVYLLRQANKYINNVEQPYKVESVIRVQNCLYARYVGPEEMLKLAYDKISVAAFEEEIELSNENYTIFVDQQDENIVADVFVEKK